MTAPTEVTTRYATSVEDLPSAWQFVMAHVDRVGDRPHIEINPITTYRINIDGLGGLAEPDTQDTRPHTTFEVVVSGMVEEEQ